MWVGWCGKANPSGRGVGGKALSVKGEFETGVIPHFLFNFASIPAGSVTPPSSHIPMSLLATRCLHKRKSFGAKHLKPKFLHPSSSAI